MFRQLKYHEQKLLKKTNPYSYKSENNHREVKVIRKYHLEDREDYQRYNKIVGYITSLLVKIKGLPMDNVLRIKMTEQLLDKMYDMGLINNKQSLEVVDKVGVSHFCRRRLNVVLQSLKFCETLKEANTFISQGHIRIGTQIITQPSTHVTRRMEDYIKWVDNSKIKKKIMSYKDKLDDYDIDN